MDKKEKYEAISYTLNQDIGALRRDIQILSSNLQLLINDIVIDLGLNDKKEEKQKNDDKKTDKKTADS